MKIKDFINEWKPFVGYALGLAAISFLVVSELIKWIFFFWFDDLTVRTMMEHGFYWGGGFGLVVFVMYLLTVWQSQKSDAVD